MIRLLSTAALVAAATAATPALAQLTSYTQDFESRDRTQINALSGDGWTFFGQAFEADGTTPAYVYNANGFPAPNDINAPNISVISDLPSGGTPPVDSQGLVIFSDYNNGDHRNGTNRVIQGDIFQDQTIANADLGKTFTFAGIASLPDTGAVGGSTEHVAFIKTLDPNNNFAQTNFLTFDMTALNGDINTPFAIDFSLAPSDTALVGQVLQFGFQTRASNDAPSAVNYDELSFGENTGAFLNGDFDADNAYTAADIDALFANLGNPAYDLDNDGDADSDDAARLVDGLIGTAPGDANLDGQVDTSDLAILAANFGSNVTTWAQGDFNGDGSVGTPDLAILASTFGSGTPAPPLATATVAVPEPATLALAGLGLISMVQRRRPTHAA
ncbi:MAG: PEP-CTERM sorting domain-containing protein [Planctomycetota bacterium]